MAFYSSGELGAVESMGWPRHTAGGTGTCGGGDVRAGEAWARACGVRGTEWRVLWRSGGSGGCWSVGVVVVQCMHTGCSTAVRPAELRRLWAGEEARSKGIELGCLRVAGGSSRTCWSLGLVLVWPSGPGGGHVHGMDI